MIPFNLDLETCSTCNRTCPTCLRNSHPDRLKVSAWFKKDYLPEGIIYSAVAEVKNIEGFSNTVCLNHYNEPFMDERIAKIAETVKSMGIEQVYMHSNGDLVTEEKASEIDGKIDKIIFTLYMDDPVKSKRKTWLEGLFKKTELVFITNPVHVPTHFSPGYPVQEMAEKHRMHTCLEPSMRIAINHRRQYLMCCDDLNGNFDLGTYPEVSLQDHWNMKMKDQKLLLEPGGRLNFNHCIICPRA